MRKSIKKQQTREIVMAIAMDKLGLEGATLKKQLKLLNLNSTVVTCTFFKFKTKGIQIPYSCLMAVGPNDINITLRKSLLRLRKQVSLKCN